MTTNGRAMYLQSPEDLAKSADSFDFYTTLPLTSWLRTAKSIQTQVSACEKQGDIPRAFMLATRHATLVLQKLSEYPKAERERHKSEMALAVRQVSSNLAKLEKWKPIISAQYEKELQAQRVRQAARIRREQQTSQTLTALADGSDDEYIARTSLDDTEHRHVARELAQHALQQRRSSPSAFQNEGDSISAILRTRQLLDANTTPNKPQLKSSDGLHYPDVPARHDSRWHTPPLVPPETSPPSLPSKISLPLRPGSQTPAVPSKQLSLQPQQRFRIKAYTEGGEELRTVFLPARLQTEFLNLADSNTSRDLETCGVLCASLVSNALMITHLVIPDQTSTSDTCDTTEEGDNALFNFCDQRDLIVCGWIHTHPSQTCFLSSRDLHTSAGYQISLPEAIAIVCSPRHNPSFGIFRLTSPPGLPAVLACQTKGLFHSHDETNLYTDAASPGHVVSDSSMQVEVIDLRSK